MRALLATSCLAVLALLYPTRSGQQRQPVSPVPGDTEPLLVGGGIPRGFMILGPTEVSPPGYELQFGYVAKTRQPAAWAPLSPMTVPRSSAGIAELEGRFYAVGGWSGLVEASLEQYDPLTDSWSQRADMPTARIELAAAGAQGKLFAMGGYPNIDPVDFGVVEAYDPELDLWTTVAPMPTPRRGLAAVEVDGKIYAIGGYSGFSGQILRTVEVYDPVSDTWSTGASMPTGRLYLAVAAVNDAIYAIGGVGSGGTIDVVEVYDILADAWTTAPPLPAPSSRAAAATSFGRVFVIGGWDGSYQDSVVWHEPGHASWNASVPLSGARASLGAASFGEFIYVFGGSDPSVAPLDTAEILDPGFRALFVHQRL